jgi:thioesterase domain-containing protein
MAANESDRRAAVHRKMAARKRALGAEMRLPLSEGRAHPHVYLLRGLMNVFSLGMDDLAAELRRAGIEATVTNHAESERLVNAITANYAAGDRRPIVLVGHSLGADAVMLMAASLDRNGVPVDLVVPFDATAQHEASANIARVVNMTKHFMVTPGPGFHGALANIDLSQDPGIDHLNIDKSPRLHAEVLNDVRQLMATPRMLSRQPAPAVTSMSGG